MSFTTQTGVPTNFNFLNVQANDNHEFKSTPTNWNALNGNIASEAGNGQADSATSSNNRNFQPAKKSQKAMNSNAYNTESKEASSFSSKSNATSLTKKGTFQNGHCQSYSSEEVSKTGPLFPSPEEFGFQRVKKGIPPRPTPNYFLTQPKCLHTPVYVQSEWDRQNQIKMEQMESANQGKDYQGLYEDLQKLRETERKEMEKLGLVDAENTAKHLNEAIAFQGTCSDMCPVFERVRRQLENNVNMLERDPTTNKITKEKAVKAFSRPAAGQPPPLPSEVRPPHVLKTTLDYLIDNVVGKLPDSHSFLWDRTRSIRQDFTYQNSFGPEAVDCNERIVRIHLLSLHIMAGSDVEFSQQQELEQFNKALQTLMEIYQDVRNNGGSSPNEAEFRAYHLLSHIRDPELERQIQNLPEHIFQDERVQLALKFRKIISQNNIVERGVTNLIGALDLYVEFFRVVYSDTTPLLMACLLETHFSEIRFYALKAMSRSFHTRGKPYQMDTLRNLLGFDSSDKFMKFLKYYEIDVVIEDGETLVDLFNKDKLEKQYKLNSFYDKPKYPPVYSSQLDRKLKGTDLKAIINSGVPNQTFHLKSKNEVLATTKRSISNPVATSFKPDSTTFTAITPVADALKPSEVKFSPTPPPDKAKPNLEKDVFSQPKVQATTSSFGYATNTQPNFQFGVANDAIVDMRTKSSPVPNKNLIAEKPKIDFSFSKPFGTPEVASGRLREAATIPETKSRSLFSAKEADQVPSSQILSTKIESSALPITSKKLADHHLYRGAVEEVVNQYLANMVDSETKSVLASVLFRHNAEVQRFNIIKTLEDELFSAFVAESTYQCTLEAAATYTRDLFLKKQAVSWLAKRARECVTSYRSKQAKRNELESVRFGNPLKRRSSSDVSRLSTPGKKHRHDLTATDFVKKQAEMKRLWEPLNLKKFADTCTSKVSLTIAENNIKLKWLLVVEDWESQYSKWLIAKFGLKANMKKMVYENMVESDKVDLEITSLPRKEFLTKDFFHDCSFILFECGLCSESSQTIESKLSSDAKVLKKIISMCERYTYYKPSILILFWNATQSEITTDRAIQLLNLEQTPSTKTIKDLIFCDMANESNSISQVLTSSVEKLAMDFDAGLSARGVKHAIKVREKRRMSRVNEKMEHIEPTGGGDSVAEKAKKLMENARKLQKYDYLNRAVKPTPTTKPSNPNTSIGDFAHKSLAQIIAHRGNRYYNSSIFSRDSTFLNTSVMSNNSVFNNFGRGVVQESTPNASFRRKGTDETELEEDTGDDDKLRELRKLTASIRSKYKKTNSEHV
ncbi:SAC3 [Candida theae]|uniref:Nuclear mRNA export factor n=1 Tax=Candida theae TaxID=1198502 RepID=A0AAD5BB39_9ASCO|nr:SAC3 [Candida theae]KAI5949980.1 SAC3 [Candida theae]